MYVYLCTYVHIYIHIYVYTYMCIYIHIQKTGTTVTSGLLAMSPYDYKAIDIHTHCQLLTTFD